MIGATNKYQTWLKGRIIGVYPSFTPSNLLMSNSLAKVKDQLVMRLEQKEEIEVLAVNENRQKEENFS